MAPVYPTSHKLYAFLNDVRTDISADVIGDIVGQDWGIMGNGPLDRIGSTGQLKFSLNNSTGKYTPGSLTALAGWDEGIAVELALVYEGNTYLYRFYVESIKPPVKFQDIQTKVTAVDWLKYSARDPIENPGALVDKRGNEIINETLALMPIQPQNLHFDEGVEVFPVAFDKVTSHTKAYDEMVKVALSEIGYVYIYKDRQYGETLRFENATSRAGTRPLSSLPVSQANSGFLLKPGTTDYIRTPANDRIILNQVTDAVIDNVIMDVVSEYGRDVINHFTATATPRRVDTSPVVLFKLDRTLALGRGVEVEIKGTYADPAGGGQIAGQGMIDPVITTDYLVNSQADGLGTNISAGLVFTFIQLGTDGFVVRVKNTWVGGAVYYNGFLTKFNVRGYGIYEYNPISVLAKNQASIDQRGTKTMSMTQKYKDELYAARIFVEAEVDRNRNPRMLLNAIGICANTSAALMTAFLNLHAGDLTNIIIDKLNIDGHYYIQGVDNVSITTGGVINFDWVLKEALSLQSGLSAIAVEFDAGNYVNYGYMPQLSNIMQKTISVRIYETALGANQAILSQYSAAAGFEELWAETDVTGKPVYARGFSTGNGQWRTTNDEMSARLNQWVMLTVTFDASTFDIVMYINGSSVAVTQIEAPSGTLADDTGNEFILGNELNAELGEYIYNFFGKIKDVRIYDRILTSDEVTALYNSGTVNPALVTNGLVFQGPAVRTAEYADYVDDVLTTDQKLIDNIFHAVGTPDVDTTQGTTAPTGRAP